jgi:hypothetical protein
MADKDDKTSNVPEQKLDSGYSQPSDSRQEPEVRPNAPGADFEHLREVGADKNSMPLDSTPAGQAMGNDGGRTMTQAEASIAKNKN